MSYHPHPVGPSGLLPSPLKGEGDRGNKKFCNKQLWGVTHPITFHMAAFSKINPKAQFINLHAVRSAKPGNGKGIATQRFESLLGGSYTKVAEKSQAEKEIAATPQPQVGRFWRPA